MLKTNGFSEAKSCQSPIGRRRRQTPGKKFRKPPLDFLLETLLYTKHYRLSNIKKSLPIEHFKAAINQTADGNDQTVFGRNYTACNSGPSEKAIFVYKIKISKEIII